MTVESRPCLAQPEVVCGHQMSPPRARHIHWYLEIPVRIFETSALKIGEHADILGNMNSSQFISIYNILHLGQMTKSNTKVLSQGRIISRSLILNC